MSFRRIAMSLLSATSLLVAADFAAAQACGDPAVAEPVSELIYAQGAAFGQIEPSACAKIARGGAAGCHRMVAQVALCRLDLWMPAFRAGTAACRAAGRDPSFCRSNYGGALEDLRRVVESDADAQHALCDDFAADFLARCLGEL
jgi:hypothetical protein